MIRLFKWLFMEPERKPFSHMPPLNHKLLAVHMRDAARGTGKWAR